MPFIDTLSYLEIKITIYNAIVSNLTPNWI